MGENAQVRQSVAGRIAPGSAWLRLGWLAVAACLAAPSLTPATTGAYRESPHGNRTSGVLRVPGARRGECTQCHGSVRAPGARSAPAAAAREPFTREGNDGCTSCHATPLRARSWLGPDAYRQSLHASSPAMVWPGPVPPARPSSDAGKCVNCHDPHGAKDGAGLIPAMLRVRGTALCLRCHDGRTGPDVAAAFSRPYRHPLVAEGGPSGLPGTPASGTVPGADGVTASTDTCGGCHNPHAAGADHDRALGAGASSAVVGVRRVRLSGAARGASPLVASVAAGDLVAPREFEVCLRCHAGPGTGAVRVTADIAAAVNPANASFHPVQARGRNVAIDPRTFTQGWTADRLVRCSDCHASDVAGARGPHGSTYPHILKKPYPSGPAPQPASQGDLCFDCHRWATYGAFSGGAAAAYSLFPGHGSHAAKGLSCWACHDAHGSPELPGLLVLRSPGLAAYARDAAGASCTTTCHVASRPVQALSRAARR